MKAKICGLKNRSDVLAADEAGAYFLGFVFYTPSPRNVSPQQAGEISADVSAKKVAVTVDASDEILTEIIEHLQPDYIQLHGKESEQRAAEIKAKFSLPLIRSCAANEYPESELYDFLLIDSPGGGTGKQFDYTNFTAPNQSWFLSGGLDAENLVDAVQHTGARMVDVSSGVEREKGVKDAVLIREFMKKSQQI